MAKKKDEPANLQALLKGMQQQPKKSAPREPKEKTVPADPKMLMKGAAKRKAAKAKKAK